MIFFLLHMYISPTNQYDSNKVEVFAQNQCFLSLRKDKGVQLSSQWPQTCLLMGIVLKISNYPPPQRKKKKDSDFKIHVLKLLKHLNAASMCIYSYIYVW